MGYYTEVLQKLDFSLQFTLNGSHRDHDVECGEKYK